MVKVKKTKTKTNTNKKQKSSKNNKKNITAIPKRKIVKDKKISEVKSKKNNIKKENKLVNIKNNDKKKSKAKAKSLVKNPKKVKKKSSPNKVFLTKEQMTLLSDYKDQFSQKSIGDLKDILKTNNQKISGNKSELVERCADGKLLGAIPRCSVCSGGKLRFHALTGEYFCPGFMEDTTMINCSFKSKEVVRNAWINN